jgi:parallel beta-helix repeat protein
MTFSAGTSSGRGGRFELEDNLECPYPSRGVTVRDGAILDLNGHIVACPGEGDRCMVLTGAGARLLNGAVQGGLHESIVLEGTGRHIVRNVTSTFVDRNILVLSSHNQLINVTAESTIHPAFTITGNDNRLIDSIALCDSLFFGACIDVEGDENLLIKNFATSPDPGSELPGFRIRGDHNVLRRNRAIRNNAGGIVVSGTGNRLERNTALENSLDLRDTNGDCAQNTWKQNTFRTSDPPCIQ